VSTAIQLNNEQLKPFFDWFQEKIAVLGRHTALNTPFVTSNYTNSICIEDDARRKRVVDFLNLADLSIEDLKITSHRFSPDSLPEDMPPLMRDEMMRHMKDQTFHDVAFLHRDLESGDLVSLDEQVESDGTRGLYAFAGPWLDVMDNDRVLIVDELDTSLHPLIVHQLVRLLQTQGKHAQLVFTTHDTSIMSAKVMRRDQVWFVERGTTKSTRLYSLAEFSVREQEAIEKGYLGGRYGAIPFLRDLTFNG
jgi:hypothetical protein